MTQAEPFDPAHAAERQEIRDHLGESAAALQRERIAAETTSTGKVPNLQERLVALGFDDEAQPVFDLLPLLHVAWCDGEIQAGERALILNLLQIRGVGPGKAYTTIEALLEKRPSKAYLEESLAVLRELIADKSHDADAETIVGLCVLLAESAGGFLGIFRRVSADERDMIQRIAKALGPEAEAAFRNSSVEADRDHKARRFMRDRSRWLCRRRAAHRCEPAVDVTLWGCFYRRQKTVDPGQPLNILAGPAQM